MTFHGGLCLPFPYLRIRLFRSGQVTPGIRSSSLYPEWQEAESRDGRGQGGGTGGSFLGPGRLAREYALMQRQGGLNHVVVRPDLNDLLTWHFVLHDFPVDSPYHGGVYHGKLVFPSNYPFAPPAIFMLTPSGRFEVNQKLCVSMSDFHPETWSPSWRLETIVTGFLSFMLDAGDPATHGSIRASPGERRRLALASFDHNRKHKDFSSIFPEFLDESKFDPVRGFSLAGGCSAPHCSASSSCSSCPRSALMAMQRTLRRWFAGYDCPTRWAEKDKVTAGEREHTCEENADDKIAQREGSVAGGKPLAQATGAASPSASEHEHAQGRSTAESAESTLRPEKDRKQQNAVTSSEGSLYRKLPLCALCVVICSVVVAIASQLHHVPVLRHG